MCQDYIAHLEWLLIKLGKGGQFPRLEARGTDSLQEGKSTLEYEHLGRGTKLVLRVKGEEDVIRDAEEALKDRQRPRTLHCMRLFSLL